ncbi:hypothetical protein KSW81_006470 [Nannochloris sp. 'desiccata']|nr:hypothetical protein KSW81_006470 [Chlorella desiccata (nom. nud.)]
MQARLHVFASSHPPVLTQAQADHQVQGPKRLRSSIKRNRTPPHQADRGASSTAAASSATAAAPTLGLADSSAAYQHRALQVLSRYRALVVDAAYRPIDVEKADVLEYYDATISSTREEYYLPAVMKARWYNGKKTSSCGS